MNKTIVYLLYALVSFTVSTLYAQVNNRQQSANNNAQEAVLFYHTVERGETVFSISRTYDVDTNAIYRLNPGSREVIKTGQQLKIPQNRQDVSKDSSTSEERFIYHTIQPKETLFSVSQKYNVSAKNIVDANPGLSVATFQTGKNIRIPVGLDANENKEEVKQEEVKYAEYKVEKRATMFSLLRRFEVTEAQLVALNPELKKGLKEGMIIKVPIKSAPAASGNLASGERDANALLNQQFKINRADTVKLALLLPFMLGEANSSSNTSRFVEYYEGLLLAVDSLQKSGVSLKLTIRDSGYGIKKLNEILKEKSIAEAHLIIGGVDNDQIELLGAFAHKNQIKYVIPFSSRNDDVRSNASILQVNTPHSYLFSLAAQTISTNFKDCNIIFVDTKDVDDKLEFIGMTKQELSQHNIFFRDVNYNKDTFTSDIEKLLRKDKRNLIIPMSGKLETFNKIKQPLRTLAEKMPELRINMFGYPEWQTYIRETLDDFFFFDTYIYSNFYADNRSSAVTKFNTKYRVWYNKTLSGFPKLGMLGFDTGMFFIGAIARYGVNFENSIEKFNNYRGLQMAFRFKRANNWGGFINSSLFIVHYSKDNLNIQWQEVKL